MGEDQEGVGLECLHHRVCKLFRLHETVDPRDAATFVIASHLGSHGLGAEGKDLDPLIPVCDIDIFRQSHRCVLGHRVRGRSDLAEQTRRRSRHEQCAAAPLDHAGDDPPRHIDVGHDIDFPDTLPGIIGSFNSSLNQNPGV